MRAAAADGAELVALPEKWNLLAGGEELVAGAEPLDGPSLTAARGWARELGDPPARRQHLRARREGEKAFNTSVLIGPDGEDLAVYRKIHMFDVDVGGVAYRESEHEEPGEEIVAARRSASSTVGLTVCYDLRFPELYRILAVRGARLIAVPSAFTAGDRPRPLGGAAARPRDREPGLRRRPEPGRRGAAALRLLRPLGDRRPLGRGAGQAPDGECFVAADLDLAAQERVRASLPSLANRRPEAYGWPQPAEARRLMAPRRRRSTSAARSSTPRSASSPARASTPPASRTSPTRPGSPTASSTTTSTPRTRSSTSSSPSAGRCCWPRSRRWTARRSTPREKLDAVAGFIIDSYRHEPELMKVIIVEVTRAANSFGRTHLPEIRRAYDLIAKIVADGQRAGAFRRDVDPSSPRCGSTARSSSCSRAGSSS